MSIKRRCQVIIKWIFILSHRHHPKTLFYKLPTPDICHNHRNCRLCKKLPWPIPKMTNIARGNYCKSVSSLLCLCLQILTLVWPGVWFFGKRLINIIIVNNHWRGSLRWIWTSELVILFNSWKEITFCFKVFWWIIHYYNRTRHSH